jgi:hypothetical protein
MADVLHCFVASPAVQYVQQLAGMAILHFALTHAPLTHAH